MDNKNGSEGKVRKQYSAEFKAEAVRLVTSGERRQAEVARNLGVGSSTISKWCREVASINEGGASGRADSEELKRLREENRRLKLEQEILKKAAAYFAKNQM